MYLDLTNCSNGLQPPLVSSSQFANSLPRFVGVRGRQGEGVCLAVQRRVFTCAARACGQHSAPLSFSMRCTFRIAPPCLLLVENTQTVNEVRSTRQGTNFSFVQIMNTLSPRYNVEKGVRGKIFFRTVLAPSILEPTLSAGGRGNRKLSFLPCGWQISDSIARWR